MRHLVLVALLAAASGCVSTDTFRKKESEANQLRADLTAEQARNKAVQEQVAALRGELDGVQLQAKDVQDRLKVEQANLLAKQTDLKALSDRNAELQALVDQLSRSKQKLEQAKAELEKRSTEYQQLASSLQGEIESGKVELSELKGKLTVKMKDKILFASGVATIGRDGRDALAKVAEALRGVQGKVIRIEGHTDDVPTGGGQFPTNWELSVARALAVVRFLQEKGVDPTKLAAAGYGEFQPIAGNDTADGRSLNRRIEIVLATPQ